MCLFFLTGCAHIRAETVSVVTEPENGSVVNIPAASHKQPEEPACRIETVPPLDELALKLVELKPDQEPAKESWDIPPFTWAPSWCSEPDETDPRELWPDFSSVHEAECTWWFFPQARSHSKCRSTWVLQDNRWTQLKVNCTKLNSKKNTGRVGSSPSKIKRKGPIRFTLPTGLYDKPDPKKRTVPIW